MLSEMLYASHGNDANRKDDQGARLWRCGVNGCDALRCSSITCRARSNPTQWDRISQLQNQVSSQQNRALISLSEPQNLRRPEEHAQRIEGRLQGSMPPRSEPPLPANSANAQQPTVSGGAVLIDGRRPWSRTPPLARASRQNEHAQYNPASSSTLHHVEPAPKVFGPKHPPLLGPSPPLLPMITQADPRNAPQLNGASGCVSWSVAPAAPATAATAVPHPSQAMQTPQFTSQGSLYHAVGSEAQHNPPPNRRDGPALVNASPRKTQKPTGQPMQASKTKPPVIVIDLTDETTPPPEATPRTRSPSESMRHDGESGATLEPPGPGQSPPNLGQETRTWLEQMALSATSAQAPLDRESDAPAGTPRSEQINSPTVEPDTIIVGQADAASQAHDDDDGFEPEDQVNDASQPAKDALPGAETETPRVSYAEQNKASIRAFDSDMFDALIYQQEGAASPPEGVAIDIARSAAKGTVARRAPAYLPVNPQIHRPYTRSKEWRDRKSEEIRSRPRRKTWFGKAAERQRWLWAQNQAREARAKGKASRRDPQPWTYSRPLDYGDVPPENLPPDVLKNPAWAKACAWHRKMRQMEHLRQRERQRAVQQTQQQAQRYLKSVLGGSEG